METLFLTYFVIAVYMQDQCTSQCISNCRYCDNKLCTYCNDGFFLDYNRNDNYCYKCRDSCIYCTSWNNCNSCKPGYYGNKCDVCLVGYYRNNDNCHLCRLNCISCTDWNSCTSCKTGYYGTQCDFTCSSGCQGSVCNTVTGACTCFEGFTGSKCDTCKVGSYGNACNLSCGVGCPNGVCEKRSGVCSPCTDGYRDYNCTHTCSEGCVDMLCRQNDAVCTRGCKGGYSGDTCQISCPKNCLSCSHDGECVTCKGEFSKPDKQCQCLNTICTSYECMSCANSTYYVDGPTCCPCNINCKHGTCTSADHCTDGCEDGLFGPKCEFQCTHIDIMCSVCIGNSLESSVCKSCANGYYPDKNRTCVPCSTSCVEGLCNSSNGHCEKGCKDGFWNPRCDRNCNDKCTDCNQDSGDCLTCSLTSVFGANCNMTCSNTCFNASCHMNGTCTHGCITDYYGPSCEQSCSTNCARSGNGTLCSLATGLCLFGCIEGFQGEGCVGALKSGNSKNTAQAAAIGGGVAAVVIVALVVVVGISIFIRRRNRTPLYDNVVREANADGPEHTYDGMNVSVVTAKECSTTVVSTDYQNTSDRLTKTPEQSANEEHTYESAI